MFNNHHANTTIIYLFSFFAPFFFFFLAIAFHHIHVTLLTACQSLLSVSVYHTSAATVLKANFCRYARMYSNH